MKQEDAIYPIIKTEQNGIEIKLQSCVRIKHNRKYYIIPVITNSYYNGNFKTLEEAAADELRRFNLLCYLTLICYKVTKDSITKKHIFLDTSQIEETERLKKGFVF